MRIDAKDTVVTVAGRELSLLVPSDGEALLDEEAFAADEFMPYWAELWPSGLLLAEALDGVRGRVLELGCGLGLPSLVAALGGAEVTATDWAADAIELLEVNAGRVGAALDARRWDWTGDPGELGAPFDLVVAADVLYERRNAGALLAALPRLGDEVWIADPERAAAPGFFAAAADDWDVVREGRLWRLTASGGRRPRR